MWFFHVSVWRRESLVTQLLDATARGGRSRVFGTTRLLLLCDSLLPPPHLREGGCGGEKEMSVLASLPWKRKIRDGAMAKALLPLLALHNRGLRNLGLEHYPAGAGHTISSSRFCTPEGIRILGCIGPHLDLFVWCLTGI